MKISLNWLKDYVDYSGSAQQLADLLTCAGLNLESVEPVGPDWMIDVEITSNRPDCLGHIGIAREVAALTGATLRLPETNCAERGKNVTDWAAVVDEAPELCGRYTARIIDGVRIGPSPDWMKARLETVGVRAISNVVDVTNYVMMEIGQPLHSFDYAKLNEGRIVVRRARPGEQLVAIDQTTLALNESHLVIADAKQPVALAGVMGGLASEVTSDTRTILLESAHFDPLSIRTTSRALTLGSESSFRFERNVDIDTADWASRRAAALLADLAGGDVAPGVIDVWPARREKVSIAMRLSRLRHLLGVSIESQTVLTILTRLGFAPAIDEGSVVRCAIPSWRNDVRREVDLIEEVIRIHGYNHIPTENKIHIAVTTEDAWQRGRGRIAGTLNACGYFETVNVSFVDDSRLGPFVEPGFEPLRVKDVTRRSTNALRPTLLPSLLEVRKRNQDAGNDRCDCYEISAVHQAADRPGELPHESIMLGLLTAGDFRELRGAIEAVVSAMDKNTPLVFQPCQLRWSRPGAAAKLRLADIDIGFAAAVSDEILKIYDLQTPLCLAEIQLDPLIRLQKPAAAWQPLIRLPGIRRDLSLILDESVRWSDIEAEILSLNIDNLRKIEFVGVYRGKGVDPGKKSLTLSLHLRSPDETLTHEQADQYQQQILAALTRRFAAALRV
jgi:phenylalanyl-tRNA synthetase beta chain